MNVFDYFFQNSRDLSKDLVVGPTEQVSYQALYSNCLHAAHEIKAKFGTNNNMLIISENSAFFITAYLSILKSGNVCVPLSPNIEAENLSNILDKTGAVAMFVSKRFERKYSDYPVEMIGEAMLNAWIGSGSPVNGIDVASRSNDQDLAEIIFTSGSTGEQKGVMITHGNIMANTDSIIEYLGLTANDTIEVVMPFYYCYGLSLLHTHLRVGGSVVLNNSFIFLGSVIRDLNTYQCTGFAGVPSHFQILLRKSQDFKNTKFEHLRYVTQAGGKLHNTFIQEFSDAFPELEFFVMYGQTEATARLSYLPPHDLRTKLGSIGKGIPGVELKVVDAGGKEVRPGETGEIIARGGNIMAGYYKDREATEKTLRAGWLYTGDLATVDEDGYIFIQSRKKEIIKVRGIRISPKEIEEVIFAYPGVVDCTIKSTSDDVTGEAIKAIVYINDGDRDKFTAQEIQNHCAVHLAQHKIPQVVEFDTRLAFNATGKKTKA